MDSSEPFLHDKSFSMQLGNPGSLIWPQSESYDSNTIREILMSMQVEAQKVLYRTMYVNHAILFCVGEVLTIFVNP
jgi:hypothetical protein